MSDPCRVAVIGCGPGGMFFLHALEKLRVKGEDLNLDVKVFERAEAPGGVWRAQRNIPAQTYEPLTDGTVSESSKILVEDDDHQSLQDIVRSFTDEELPDDASAPLSAGSVSSSDSTVSSIGEQVRCPVVASASAVPSDTVPSGLAVETSDLSEPMEIVVIPEVAREPVSDDTLGQDGIPGVASAPTMGEVEQAAIPVDASVPSVDDPPMVASAKNASESVIQQECDKEETSNETSTEMYEALWINGPKEAFEFYDYTFEDHYGRGQPLPAYMPRQAILEYMTARVTQHAENLYEKYVQFHTEVRNVAYNETTQKFTVTTHNLVQGTTTTELFDKCIWAAGENGRPYIPQNLDKLFTDFPGTVVHSSQASNLLEQVARKTVLLIGGSFSAEDLALMSLKLGALHVYIAIRHSDPDIPVLWQEDWPEEKVTVLEQSVPIRVEGNSIYMAEYDPLEEKVLEDSEVEILEDVNTVIYCTGYDKADNMLDKSVYCLPENEEPCRTLDVPSDWRMRENKTSKALGVIEPSKHVSFDSRYVNPCLYRRFIQIHNHNLMYFDSEGYDAPLLGIDIQAHYMVNVLAGKVSLPRKEEMLEEAVSDMLQAMHEPMVRLQTDPNYRRAFRSHPCYPYLPGAEEAAANEVRCQFQFLARLAKDGLYPVDLGTFQQPNATSEAMVKMSMECRDFYTDPDERTTFRDIGASHCEHLASVHTGAKPVPFRHIWMDLDDFADPRDLV